MQVRKFLLELDMIMGVTANVACSTRSSAHIMQSVFHCADNVGMLAHAQIIVRAPYCDVFWTIMSSKAACVGVITLVPKDIDEYAIAALGMKPVNCLIKNSVIIHGY